MARIPMSPTPINSKTETAKETQRWLNELIDRADAGDATALSELRRLLDQVPWLISQLGGDLAKQAANSLISGITGKHLASKELVLRRLDLMRAELGGPNPSAIEKLLVDRVVACLLQAQHADYMAAEADDDSVAIGDYHQRRQDRANRRVLLAVKTLATVRRLALPIRVDVNVTGGVETKPAKPTHPSLPSWERAPSTN